MPPTLLYSPLLAHILLYSPLLAHIPHAFTTRQGGISKGIFNSLNFGNPSDLPQADRDPPANIRENFTRVLTTLHCQSRELVEVHQVHGPDVHTIRANHPAHPTPHDTKADAIVTSDPTRILAIRIADCTPVLFSSQDGKVVGIAHAGWRGVISGIIPNTIRAMQALGATQITAAIGPCISEAHFEVGPEVADQFLQTFGPSVLLGATARGPQTPTLPPPQPPRSSADHPAPPSSRKPHINLKHAIHLQLQTAGITHTDILPHCTYRDRDLFFSHRRDHGRTGRMAALIGPR